MFLQTEIEGLVLKLIHPMDADELFDVIDNCRPHLRNWLPFVDGTKTVKDTLSFITSAKSQFGRNDGFQMGIVYEGQLQGMVGLHYIDWTNRRTSIGYWLAEGAQGHGHMTAACEALISFCFTYYNLNRIELHAAETNTKSRAVAERLGFKCEGIVRDAEWLYDHFVDHAAYALLKRDWESRG